LGLLLPARAQAPPAEPAPALPEAASDATAQPQSEALKLYRELRSQSLDPNQVYKIREASLDVEDIHISLNDGVIGFTKAVNGRITGAYFRGDGEILLIPPDNVERASLALHIGSAVLGEQFRAGFFRFNDDTAAQLQSALRGKQDGDDFVSEYNGFVGRLSEQDALRLLASFLRAPNAAVPDRMFRARLDGLKLGIFDVAFDSLAGEQIGVARFARSGENIFYDLLASFPMHSARNAATQTGDVNPQDIEYGGMLGSARVRKYVIRARIEPPHTLDAQATLETEITASGERVIFLELSRYLKVRSVTADGQPIEFLQNEALEGSALARRGNDLVALIFPQPLQRGQRVQLKFDYAGPVLSEAGGGLLSIGARGTWSPNHGRAFADFDLEFRSPAEWTLVATGKRVSQHIEGEEQVSHWVSEAPIALAGFNLGEYTEITAKAGTVPIEVYAARGMEKQFPTVLPPDTTSILRDPPVPPPSREATRFARGKILPDAVFEEAPPPRMMPDPARNAREVAHEAGEMVEFLSQHAGPFPYSSLVVSQRPGSISQGWPGLVYLSSYAFLSPEQRAAMKLSPYESILFGGLMTRHEVAHQWWGDLVGWKSYRDQWLVEALSTYSALLSMEKDDPKQVQAVLDYYRDQLESENANHEKRLLAGPVTLGFRLSSSHFPNGYELVSYGRGTWLLHMLRYILRDAYAADADGSARSAGLKRGKDANPDEHFFRVLQRLQQEFAGKDISTADLQRLVEAELPDSYRFERRKSLDWFFQGWVNGTAIPRLDLESVKLSRKGNTMIASGTLLQKDAPENLVTSVPIYASDGNKLTLLGRVFADGNKTSFDLKAPLSARKLVLDPYHTILREQ
jgi:hypothetical protein